jgi:hypothetical protein
MGPASYQSAPPRAHGVSAASRTGQCNARAAVSGTASLLRLGLQVALSGRQVNRNRNVLVRDRPLAFDVAVAVGYAHGKMELVALGVGTRDALDIVAVGESAPTSTLNSLTSIVGLSLHPPRNPVQSFLRHPNPCTGAAGSRRTRPDRGCRCNSP